MDFFGSKCPSLLTLLGDRDGKGLKHSRKRKKEKKKKHSRKKERKTVFLKIKVLNLLRNTKIRWLPIVPATVSVLTI